MTAWMTHLNKTRKENPKLSMKEAMMKASSTYKKQKGGCCDKPCQCGKGPKLDKVKEVAGKVTEGAIKLGCKAIKAATGKVPKRCERYDEAPSSKPESKPESKSGLNSCQETLCRMYKVDSKTKYNQLRLQKHPDKVCGGYQEGEKYDICAKKANEDYKKIPADCTFPSKEWSCQNGSGPYIMNGYTPAPDGTRRYLVPNYQDLSYNIPAKYDIQTTGFKSFP